ncbi:hypothetical protein HMPREF1015_02151 [Bacillus smithii 7_3_47FAA]|uniref:Uncharacterized protein n=1 Tax=Bacillus smithii 7_3_47FAA TaxID=665952 RepID=G9QIZ0_9BACI|nr:Hypothetical protein BSM4216_0928 [Bacillus smithii]EHL78912.1 hypothetical protein HMPREF1015_02151 [Bacillus smithii 7_3_47FAA]
MPGDKAEKVLVMIMMIIAFLLLITILRRYVFS